MMKNYILKAFRLWVLILLAGVAWHSVHAQGSYTVTGKVTDVNGEPLMGVTVQAPGNAGTATDLDGSYTIRLTKPARLTFSYIGYDTHTLDVASGGTHNVVVA